MNAHVTSGIAFSLGGLMVLAIVLRTLGDRFKANRRRDRRRNYQTYLRSPEWKARRQVAITKAAGRCRDCGKPTSRFEVHHLTYRRFGREHPKDIRAICRDCHKRHHRRRKSGADRTADWLTN